jgi:uncharacterized membrane protein YqjE
VELYLHSPNTPSWHGAQLKHRDNFTFYLVQADIHKVYFNINMKKSNLIFITFFSGTVGLVFSAFGILLSGLIISKYKPRARYLAAWNVIVGIISVLGIISYAFLGCPASDNQGALLSNGE